MNCSVYTFELLEQPWPNKHTRCVTGTVTTEIILSGTNELCVTWKRGIVVCGLFVLGGVRVKVKLPIPIIMGIPYRFFAVNL